MKSLGLYVIVFNMARTLRVEFPGALYYLCTQGNNKQNIFDDDRDRELFLEVLAGVVEKYHWICHAFCLMENHYILLIETPDGNLSLGMRQLNGVYTQTYNKTHNKTGHLFQGRFSSLVVEKETFLLKVCRETVLAPVRSKEVNHPRAWRWSSFPATIGMAKPPDFLNTDWILGRFGENIKDARHGFTEFIVKGIDEEPPWGSVRGRILLGSDAFIDRIKVFLEGKESVEEYPLAERFATRPTLEALFKGVTNKEERNRQLYAAHVTCGYSLKEIGRFLGIHYSTVSKALKKQPGSPS